jgi:hypothetical protein
VEELDEDEGAAGPVEDTVEKAGKVPADGCGLTEQPGHDLLGEVRAFPGRLKLPQ